MKAFKPALALILLAAIAIGAWLQFGRGPASELHIANATAAPIADTPGAVGVFLTIENHGGPDVLTGAHSAAAGGAALDAPAPTLAIPAGSDPALSPDGAFIRLTDVSGTLEDGRIIPVALSFENAGTLTINARLSAPKSTGAAHQFGLFGIGDVCKVGEGEPAPQIALSVSPEGDGWRVEVEAQEFTFAPDLADGPHVPGTGHGHLYLNGLKLQRLYEPSAHIGALPPGRHEVRVTLNTNDHRAYVVGEVPVTARAVIEQP